MMVRDILKHLLKWSEKGKDIIGAIFPTDQAICDASKLEANRGSKV